MKPLQQTIVFATVLLVTLVQLPAHADTMGLINSLTSGLGVSKQQATGGAGAIFDYAKNNMSAADFTKVANGLPGIDSLIGAAPQADSGGLLGGISSLGGSSGGAMGELAGRFGTLGLSPESINEFIPVILEYAQSEGGAQVMNLLKGALL